MNEMIYEYAHGGNIYDSNGFPYKNILDFSSSINPLGTPSSALIAARRSLEQSARYPDSGNSSLIKSLAAYENVSSQHLFCSNGASDIIFRIVTARKPKKILVTAPSFADYERAGRALGAEIIHYPLKKENGFNIHNCIVDVIKTTLPDIVFICNPNNPTGCLTQRKLLIKIAIACAIINSTLVVDECFLDFVQETDKYSAKPLLNTYSNLVVLKAFTKTFAMPGLRLGYAICSDEVFLDHLRLCGADWSVSNVAQAAGIAVLEDEREYVSKSISFIETERNRIAKELVEMGFTVYPSYANFIFFQSTWNMDLSHELRKKGILIRDCSNFVGLTAGYYRIAVLSEDKNNRLIESLKQLYEV